MPDKYEDYSSRVPRFMFGYHWLAKRGYTKTAKAGLIFSIGFMVMFVIIAIVMVVFIAALGSSGSSSTAGSQGGAVGANTQTSDQTQTQPTVSVTTPVPPPSVPPLVATPVVRGDNGTNVSMTPLQIATTLAQVRYNAFCKGGSAGESMLDQVWEYRGNPTPLGYALPNELYPNNIDQGGPIHTYAMDLQQIQAGEQTTGWIASQCAYASNPPILKIIESKKVGSSWVIESLVGDSSVYPGVYDLLGGHWYLNQTG